MNSAVLQNNKVTRRLDIRKSTTISIAVHLLLIFGITFANLYELPTFKESPIINIRLANSNVEQDGFLDMSEEKIETFIPETAEKLSKRKEMRAESYKVKRLEANSEVNSSEAFYLNSWQRKVETIGQGLINSSEYEANNQTVRLMATVDSFGNLLKSEILISSGNNETDELAIKILQESAPFKPFNEEMQKGYKILEIVRDWNFGG
tara:strand:+ start:1671 stop:2291 length:621 start_codon:yes stop_codon:yes gene_type:complete